MSSTEKEEKKKPAPKDSKDSKDPKEPKKPKEQKEPKESKKPKEPKDPKKPKEPKDPKKPKEPKDPKKPKEPTDPKKPKESKEPKKPKEPKEPKKPKEPKEPKKPKEPKDPNKPKESKDPNKPKEPKDPKEPKGPKDPKDSKKRKASSVKLDKPKKKKPRVGKPRNYDLGNGVMRFSRTRMYHKKALYKFIGKKVKPVKKPVKPKFVIKPIGGEKNGQERKVLLKKRPNYYPTQDKIKKHPSKRLFKEHKRFLRSTLTPGTILILLAGVHKGKRVVFLKQLKSGLLLITGPFAINACPLRRISQRYVIGTETKLDISELKIPNTLNDEYFRRQREKRPKKEDGDIFQAKKETYKVSEKRKSDQKEMDKQLLNIIKKHPDRKILYAYLSAMFGLRSSQYPHRMKF